MPKTRNPRHFEAIEGGRKRVSETLMTNLSKAMFDALRGAEPLFHARFGVKTLSGTFWGAAFNENGKGYGTRHARHTTIPIKAWHSVG